VFRTILGRTLWIAGVVTLACLLLGYPTAWYLSLQTDRKAAVLLFLVLLPFMLGAVCAHLPNGWSFASPHGGWEYPAFWAVTLAVQALLGGGAFALGAARSAQQAPQRAPATRSLGARAAAVSRGARSAAPTLPLDAAPSGPCLTAAHGRAPAPAAMAVGRGSPRCRSAASADPVRCW
ncbi:hypothetical protein PV228_14370, partial [Staphylococcus aureus]|nr:hypothetical protein [Staphylococcus aureus]